MKAFPKAKFTRPELLDHPNIPKPMHLTNPRSLLGKEWWDTNRYKAYAENNQCCWACGVHRQRAEYHQWLEGHESYRIDYANGRMELIEIVALCHACHNFIHDGRMAAMVDKGQMEGDKMESIMTRGLALLQEAGYPAYEHAPWNGEIADWGEWRMIIEGKEYEGKFASYHAWKGHFS